MRTWRQWFVVLFLPLAPLLHFFAVNETLATPLQVGMLVFGSMCLSLMLYAIIRIPTTAPEAAAAASGMLCFLLLSNIHLRNLLLHAIGIGAHDTYRFTWQLPWHAIVLLTAYFSFRLVKQRPERLKAFTVFAAVMALLPLANLFWEMGSAITGNEAADSKAPGRIEQTENRPHVLVVVLDEYAREDVLKTRFGFDNAPFLDSLRARGFMVADRSRSNFTQTLPSLTSMFSMSLLEDLAADGGGKNAQMDRMTTAFTNARVWRIFGDMGYRSVVTDTYPFMLKPNADVVLKGTLSEKLFIDLFRESTSWPFVEKLLRLAGMGADTGSRQDWIAQIQQNLDYTVEFAQQDDPVLMLTHVICPHGPFVLGIQDRAEAERVYSLSDGPALAKAYRKYYPVQLAALNTRVLRMVDAILASPHPVILLLLSDHGSRSSYNAHDLHGTDVHERTANFFAAYSTMDTTAIFENDVTLVNVFPSILNAHFEGNYPRKPKRLYYSTHDHPLDFTDVTEAVKLN